MGGRTRGEAAALDLSRAAERFRAWRRVRMAGTRIPESLWTLAIRLVEKHGVSRTSSALGLDYYSLKKRTAAASDSRSAAPAFVELPASSLAVGRECVIEMEEDGTGATMRMHLKGYEASEVAAVGRSFWKVS